MRRLSSIQVNQTPTKEQIKRHLAAALQAVNPLLTAFPFDYSELARLERITEAGGEASIPAY